MGGKAAAFEYAGQKFPLGAVGTPLALPEASFTESQVYNPNPSPSPNPSPNPSAAHRRAPGGHPHPHGLWLGWSGAY